MLTVKIENLDNPKIKTFDWDYITKNVGVYKAVPSTNHSNTCDYIATLLIGSKKQTLFVYSTGELSIPAEFWEKEKFVKVNKRITIVVENS